MWSFDEEFIILARNTQLQGGSIGNASPVFWKKKNLNIILTIDVILIILFIYFEMKTLKYKVKFCVTKGHWTKKKNWETLTWSVFLKEKQNI